MTVIPREDIYGCMNWDLSAPDARGPHVDVSMPVRMPEEARMESEDTFNLKVHPFWAELRAGVCGTKS